MAGNRYPVPLMRCSTLCRIGLFNSFYCFLSRKQAPNFIVVFGPVALRKTLNIYLYSSFLDFLSIHLTNLKAFEHGRCLLCPILLCNMSSIRNWRFVSGVHCIILLVKVWKDDLQSGRANVTTCLFFSVFFLLHWPTTF